MWGWGKRIKEWCGKVVSYIVISWVYILLIYNRLII